MSDQYLSAGHPLFGKPITLTAKQADSLRTLLGYVFEPEVRDYADGDDEAREHHIFNDIVALEQVAYGHTDDVNECIRLAFEKEVQ